jgi:hypothetical protein
MTNTLFFFIIVEKNISIEKNLFHRTKLATFFFYILYHLKHNVIFLTVHKHFISYKVFCFFNNDVTSIVWTRHSFMKCDVHTCIFISYTKITIIDTRLTES